MREEELWLNDIHESATKVILWSRESSHDEFSRHGISYSAIIREFIVIGEAVKRLSPGLTEAYPDVLWSDLARFRDVLVHQYFGLEDQIVWDAATTIVPALLATVAAIIESTGAPASD